MSVELSVLIVNWNVYGLALDCVRSVEATVHETTYEIILVDNSQDENGRRLWRGALPAGLRLIENEANRGFATANNQALRVARGDFVLLLNPDCIASESAIDGMVRALRADRRLGIVTCQLLNADRSRQTSAYRLAPALPRAFLDASGLRYAWLEIVRRAPQRDADRPRRVLWVKGACLMSRRTVVETVGLLDETFSLYGEDADWCRRVRDAGWEIAILPALRMVHLGERSIAAGESSATPEHIASYYSGYLNLILRHGGPGPLGVRRRLATGLLWLNAAERAIALSAAGLVLPRQRARAAAYRRYLLPARSIKRTYQLLLPRAARRAGLAAAYFVIDGVGGLLHPGELRLPRRLLPVGPGDPKKVGQEYLGYFRDLAGLRPDARVLDLGCGIGRLALPLTAYLEHGSYEGLDIVPAAIAWCREHITRRWPNFRFQLADVRNREYNPKGERSAAEYRFPYPDASFDFAFTQSVFTHMLPTEMTNYIAEMARVLKPGGMWFSTFYLVNPESEHLMASGRGPGVIRQSMDFAHKFDGYRTIDLKVPEAAVALDEAVVRRSLERAGLEIREPIRYGSWCGRSSYLASQDIVVATRRK